MLGWESLARRGRPGPRARRVGEGHEPRNGGVRMTITLQPITRDNLWAVVELQLHPGQEAFVADNIDSIANASVEPTWVPLAVYAGEAVVGFVMYGQHPPDTGAWWVIRLMIDRAHQGQGYGRAAMEAVIALMAERVGCEEIVTSV